MAETNLEKRLALTTVEKEEISKTAGPIKGVVDFLSDAADAIKHMSWIEAISAAAPWAAAIGEALPPIKFLVNLFKKFTEVKDPDALAYLACSIAFERAVQEAISSIGSPSTDKSAKAVAQDVKDVLSQIVPEEDYNFSTFSFDSALEHAFIKDANECLIVFATAAGFDENQQRHMLSLVNRRFVSILKQIVSHRDLYDKFTPFVTRMSLGRGDAQAYAWLQAHADFLVRQFEQAPVLGREPFPLSAIYIETDCGVLTWGQIRTSAPIQLPDGREEQVRVDPFSEQWGGRQPLLETVLELMGRRDFNDAIVIQGAAGSGKSTFTLRLARELEKSGLCPVRVRLRDLRFDIPVINAIADAVFVHEPEKGEGLSLSQPDDLFLGERVFKQSVPYGATRICPYVIILDGWDEISLSVNEGFRVRLARMLDYLRDRFLRRRLEAPVRLILTGRPSPDLADSNFLLDTTPILTVRGLRPDQLRNFVTRLRWLLKAEPLAPDYVATWAMGSVDRFEPVLDEYETYYSAQQPKVSDNQDLGQDTRADSGLEVLGLPLLAHVALRVMAQWPGDLEPLVHSPTALYRSLIDLTAMHAGKGDNDGLQLERVVHLKGNRLRELLQLTAAALTVSGRESISFDELELRTTREGESLDELVDKETQGSVLHSLVVSFYFKGGRADYGCEFLHKSFREYLFAEKIVEVIKRGGEKTFADMTERDPGDYWQDFTEDDPRRPLSRELARWLSPQWLTKETASHIEQLLEWEIDRTVTSQIPVGPGTTPPLSIDGWQNVRDILADLWDWWGEGVHLRPQPIRNRKREISYTPSLAQELVEWAAPQHTNRHEPLPAPGRTTSIDAHLGDALFRICATVHFQLARATGWLKSVKESADDRPSLDALWKRSSVQRKRCQSVVDVEGQTWVLFRPSGSRWEYFGNYINRINSAGWRPQGLFPLGCDVRGTDFSECCISIPIPDKEPTTRILWSYANLYLTIAHGSCFYGQDLSFARASGAGFWMALLHHIHAEKIDLSFAKLTGANLQAAFLAMADLSNARLEGADLSSADLSGANLSDADLANADLSGANLSGANLSGANLIGANLTQTDLSTAKLLGTIFSEDDLSEDSIVLHGAQSLNET
jgi:uncharacterized protein YjbI with pentapeptide repeats